MEIALFEGAWMVIEGNWKYYLSLSLLIYGFIPYGATALVLFSAC